MKLPARFAVCLLSLSLAGCAFSHKAEKIEPQQKLAPPVEDAPPPKPVPSPTDLPPTVISEPAKTQQAQQPAQTQEQPKPPVHHRKPPASSTQTASNGNPPGVSAIGQLSSGEGSDMRRQTEESLTAIERSLNGLGRTLSDAEQKTAAQIREYIKQARTALGSGDVDGAHTLAAKARVLLGELTK